MLSKKKLEDELYNINDYTDEELYEILDLFHPSDRELEAKILSFIQKYEDIGTITSMKIAKFFEDVYNHFFDNDDFEETQITDFTKIPTIENYQNINTEYAEDATANYISNDYKEINGNVLIPENKNDRNTTTGNTNASNVIFTSNLEYTKDPLNPLLKQTTTRIISIDSQYREDKNSITTDFTLELSEVLRDVVSMKLYSFQIPYTWYTIAKSYGSNVFFLKGNTDGINNGNHDLSFSVNPGNYSPSDLAIIVQNSIKNARTNYTDISFATTDISYNPNTSLSTLTIDIKNQYNENGYYLNFPYFTSPYRNDLSRNDSIPAFLGFETTNYNTNSIKSGFSLPLIDPSNPNQNDNSNIFNIDTSNNYFTIIKYIGPDEYNNNSVVDLSFNIYFSSKVPGKYSRNQLLNDISNSIYNSNYLDNTYSIGSSIIRKNVDPSNNYQEPTFPTPPNSNNDIYVNTPNNSYFELKIKPNRFTTNNITNSKIVIKFPIENSINNPYNIWTGNNSCFRFDPSFTELNTIYAEYPLVTQPQTFLIDNSANIFFKCIAPNFELSMNDIIINIPPNINPIDNITFIPYTDLSGYVNAINKGIQNTDISDGIRGCNAYIDGNDFFNLYLDIEKTFNESTYQMDLTESILSSTNIDITNNGNKILTDLSKTYTCSINRGGISVDSNTILAVIKPISDSNYGNKNDITYILKFGKTKYYTDYPFFENDVNNLFSNYIDPLSGRTIFAGTNLSHVRTDIGYNITFTIRIAKKLVATNYSINFSDPSNNSWESYLNIDNSLINKDYGLLTRTVQSVSITDSNDAIITGIKPIKYNYLNVIRNTNNIINFITIEDGLTSSMRTNDFEIDLLKYTNAIQDNLDITVNDLINIVNKQFNESSYFKGSSLSIYSTGNYQYLKMRMNINRIYTASDYNLVFYDQYSFVRCFVGATSVQNTTWDSTLGWILGFRNYTIYALSEYGNNGDIITIIGDTGVCTNLYNYFLLCLDDYNQNHLNDGLVTIANRATSIPLPPYGNKSNLTCDPVTGELTYNTTIITDNNKLTANQIYSLTSIANNKNQITSNINKNSVNSSSYGNGPYAQDVLGILPMKVAGLANGASYMEYGGALQNQGRAYFGPVNIRKMAISLLSDRGNKVDLNNANWSFSLVVESLNKLKPSK